MRDKFKNKCSDVIGIIELFISVCIIVMISILTVISLKEYITNPSMLYQEGFLQDFLQEMLSFAVGIEFVKIMLQHNPRSVIDVLIFATSRQLVVEHTLGVETIIRIAAIAILFVVERFVILPKTKEAPLSKTDKKDEERGVTASVVHTPE